MTGNSAVKFIKLLSSATIGFSFFWIASHPKSHLKKKLPLKRYKQFSYFPNLQYHRKNTTYHFHHWINLSVIYLLLLSGKRFRKSHLFHGLFLGSIFQGLIYKDRFKLRYPNIYQNSL